MASHAIRPSILEKAFYTGSPFSAARAFNDTAGRAPMC
jgi:hypothetical protein